MTQSELKPAFSASAIGEASELLHETERGAGRVRSKGAEVGRNAADEAARERIIAPMRVAVAVGVRSCQL